MDTITIITFLGFAANFVILTQLLKELGSIYDRVNEINNNVMSIEKRINPRAHQDS